MSAPVAVILAAGQGTRMRSAVPKLLHPLCGAPLISWPIAAAREAGARHIVVVDSPERKVAGSLDGSVVVAIQEQARGTADAVAAAAEHLGTQDTVLILAGDVPLLRPETLRRLAGEHEASGAAATMLTAVLDDPAGYGRVVRGPDGTVEKVVETKRPGDATDLELQLREVNTGVFAFTGGLLVAALEQVRADNAQGELYLPDVLPILRAGEHTVLALEIEDPTEVEGINDRVALAAVRVVAQRLILERHMRAGVTITDPASTVIDRDVIIGQDTVIAPFTSLLGDSVVGDGAEIGPSSTISDSRIGDGAKVVHSYLDGAELGERVSVGPFAYLRPGARLHAGAKAGTFVEIKNSQIGAGSKVPHLSYIGDTEVGESTNIGAGTITANYDGYTKHRTKIGSRVRISVDTALVAPVEVGDDAYTAAGSVISKDVPAGALGVARSRQENIPGYAERRRVRAESGGDGTRAGSGSGGGTPAGAGSGGGTPVGTGSGVGTPAGSGSGGGTPAGSGSGSGVGMPVVPGASEPAAGPAKDETSS